MALEVIRNINVDFHDTKYIMVNAKQYDDASRYIAITCYNQGSLFNLNASEHSAYVKYRKADGYGVLNFCRINNKGEVLVELTEQMLAVDGICYVDLVIINKGSAKVNIDTGEIIVIDDSPILSTMAFCVNVYETTITNPEIESSYEYDALNDLLQRAEANYAEVVQLAKSYAVGDADGIRDGEDTDNAKYYYEQSIVSANNADESEAAALSYYYLAKSYAVGDTGVRENEDVDNAKYYYQTVIDIINGLNSGFIPMGSISFSELATAEKATGFVYNIIDSFTTDETFVDGAGILYASGTNVYYTSDGYWDCLGGSMPTATVDEVKSYLGI